MILVLRKQDRDFHLGHYRDGNFIRSSVQQRYVFALPFRFAREGAAGTA
jgi:hypothetical protein